MTIFGREGGWPLMENFGYFMARSFAALAGLLIVSVSVRAEVIDKIRTVTDLWVQEGTIALVFFLLAYLLSRRRLYGWILPLIAVVLAGPPVIPLEFLPEAQIYFGEHYATHAQLAALLPVGASLAGVLLGRPRTSRRKQ
jgi:hypothetical protein